MDQLEAFDISLQLEGDPHTPTVCVAGEVDLATVASMRSILHEVLDGSHPSVNVDLAAVNFMDASGIGVLVEATVAARRRQVELTLRQPSPAVRYLFSLAGLEAMLPASNLPVP